MTPERWQRIESIYHAALERAPGKRTAFLVDECRGDEELIREIESLLGQAEPSLLQHGVWELPAPERGSRLGTYEILAKLGEGGMGAVYRARDTKLNRIVAVKLLSQHMAGAAAQRRFQREAQMASSLNHPHILTVHDAGEAGAQQYLVTEFLDGGTLLDWARAEKRSWRQVVELLVGVADGLSCAHEAGILHRDIKPQNILVTRSGYAKLADFGLAKLIEDSPPSAGDSTRTDLGSRPGMVIGTIAYMSPEQALGKPVDARSDIFSFGLVLYELLAGRRAFTGGSDLEILRNIIDGVPEPLGADVPEELRALVQKTLAKVPEDRYPSMRSLVADLRKLALENGGAPPPKPGSSAKTPIWTLRRVGAIALIAALAAAVAIWRFWPPASPPIRSIAVLPLENLSGDPSQEYFSDGTTEALISSLAQIGALKVISRTSAMRYKGASRPLPEIGRELGVDAIVEGSVQRSGTRVRISARLIRAATDQNLWAKNYEEDASDVLKLEADLAQDIAQGIRVQVTSQESKRLQSARQISAAAQDAYFQGRYHAWKLNEKDLKEAIGYFEQATQLQPDFAEAYAGLSHAWHERGIWGAVTFRDSEAPAKSAAHKALALNPNLADAHTALGDALYMYDLNWTGAEQELRRGVDLDPNDLEGHHYYSSFLMAAGRFPEAIQQAERAVSIDPVSSTMQSNYARILFRARRYADAEIHYKKAIDLDSQDFTAYTRLAEVYEQTGRLQEALSLVQQGLHVRGADLVKSPALARINALLGRRDEALRVLDQAPNAGSAGRSQEFALVYFALGDKDRGFYWLTRAFDERGLVVFTKFDPRFDSVRSDPRFQTLVARLRIPDTY